MNYTDKISSYWPEFGQNGKENITVADLMRHECGLPVFYPHLLHVEDTLVSDHLWLDPLLRAAAAAD